MFIQECESTMPISVTCDCGRSYQVTAKHAGKKFRCKACGERLSVPSKSTGNRNKTSSREKKSQELDLFEDLVGDDSGDDDFEDYPAREEYVSPPPRKLKRKPLPKQRQQKRRRGMPITVMIAILCEAVLIIQSSLITLGYLFAAWHEGVGSMRLYLGTSLIGGLRIAIEYILIRGFINRRNRSRWVAIALSFASLAVFGLVLITILAAYRPLPRGFFGIRDIMMHLCLIQISIDLVEITMLLLPPSGRYFNS
ncbi:MAG: hypothetical protein HOH82_24025 [Planctomycetaceae bacterium]|nr:hypothetical protein [Planctomycetaceae bacterium]